MIDLLPRSRMHRPVWPHGPWPDDAQLLLLRACVFEDSSAARMAYQEWQQQALLDELDAGSHQLLPLLYHRLGGRGSAGGALERIKGVARYYWVLWQQKLAWSAPVVSALARHNIETLMLKGAALNCTVYPAGARPMQDLDILVPRQHALRAMGVLRGLGYASTAAEPEKLIGVVHGCQFEAPGRRFIDLHWEVFQGRLFTERQQSLLWASSVPVRMGTAATRVLSPTFQVLHTCAHGARCHDAAPVRWLADLCRVIGTQGAGVDWDLLVSLAGEHELSCYVLPALTFLSEQLALPMPKQVLQSLAQVRPPLSTRLEGMLSSRRLPGVHAFWSTLPIHMLGYWRQAEQRQSLPLTEYLQRQHQFDRPLRRELPALARVLQASVVDAVAAWGSALWRRLTRAPAVQTIDMGGGQHWRLQRFHQPEALRGRLFRWTSADSSVVFTRLEPARWKIEIWFAPGRPWTPELLRELRLSFNGHDIAAADIAAFDRRLVFPLRPELFVRGERQRLTIRCRPLMNRNGDTRQLGVPIRQIRLVADVADANKRAA